jgi:hypothetical protein
MQSSFSQFLRTGGNGEFVLSRAAQGWVGRRVDLSLKSDFPGYENLRRAFEGRLDRVVEGNTATILGVIGSSFTPPLTGTDLADVSGARTARLRSGTGGWKRSGRSGIHIRSACARSVSQWKMAC